MRETFTVVDHTNSGASMYGNENNNNADVNYPGEKPYPECYKVRRYVLPVFIALTIVAVTTILIVRYFPDEENLNELQNATKKVEANTAGAFEFYPLHRKRTDTSQATGGIITTLNAFNMDLMKYLIEPLKYDIFIHLNTNATDSATFYGNASIELIAKEKTQYIVIGASDLGVIAVTLTSLERTSSTQDEIATLKITIDSYNRDKGILVIRVKDHLEPHNRYLLRIEYNGSVNRAPYGLFVIYHKLSGRGTTKTLIASNTEWPFERTIFPCFGLPTQRAIFNVNICRPSTFSTSSSASLQSTFPDSSRNCIWDRFSPTEKMATHLLGFVITDYPYVQRIMDSGVTITIWHPLDRATIVILYLLDVAPKLINTFEEYFGVRIPTNNLNIYCVPSIVPYIPAKLGLVLIPDTDTATTETEMSEQQKESLMRRLAAHIAEQWTEYFLILEQEERWIVESLVQYLEYVAIDTLEPKWNIFDEFHVNVLHPLLNAFTATSPNHKPIRPAGPHSESLYPVNVTSIFRNHEQYWTLLHYFDDNQKISPSIYSELFAPRRLDKGVCFFRMLQHVLTESVFRNSLKKFIEFGHGKIVTGNDLWNIMTAEATNTTIPGYELLPSHMTLKVIVNEWIFDSNYPILKVATGHEKRTISFEQILDKRDDENPQQSLPRQIPISYTTSEEKDFTATAPKFWLSQRNQTFQNAGFTNETWLLLNVQQTALYRVHYDEGNWQLLQDCFEQKEMTPVVRAQFLSDALFLGFNGYIDYELALNLTRNLTNEKDYVVWHTVLSHFEYIENTMVSVNDRTLNKFIYMLKRYIKYLITPVFSTIRANQTDCDTVQNRTELLLRAYIYKWACKVDDSQCVAKVRKDFAKWKKLTNPDEENPIHPNMRYATLCGMMYHADVTDFEFLFYRYLNTSYTSPNKQIYLRSLYCYKQIDRTISSLLSTTLLNDYSLWHLTEINDVWKTLAENPILSTSPFDFLVKNWLSILKNFSEYTPILANIIKGATINISGEDQLKAIHQLRKEDKYNLEYLQEVLTEVSEKTKSRINWKYRGLGVFVTWLLKTSAYDLNKATTNNSTITERS